jgi:hypothetical protein
MISSQDGWAVGNAGGAGLRPVILQWNGNTWNLNNSGLVINQDLYGVYMLDTNNDGIADDGLAVGTRRGCINPGPTILRWNGAAWSCPAGLPAAADVNLNAVIMASSTDAWAVGAGGMIVRLSGAAWSTPASGVAVALNSVFMLDTNGDGVADDGWIVGAAAGGKPTMLRWNIPCAGGVGTNTWNNCTATAIVPAINVALNGVYCVYDNDCWAVGNAGGVGQRPVSLHWDGTTWILNNSALIINQPLQEVYVIGPMKRPQAAWKEQFQ